MSNTFFQGVAKIFSGDTKPPAPLLVTGLIIGNHFFAFHKFCIALNILCPPCPTDVPASPVTMPQFCHNPWWCWRDTPDLKYIRYRRAVLCSFAVYGCMGHKIEIQEIVNKIFKFLPSNFAPPSKWRPWHVPCLPYPRYATRINHTRPFAQ